MIGPAARLLAGTGLLMAGLAAPARANWVVSPTLGTNVAGDVQAGRGALALDVGYFGWRHLGLELDACYHPHFFRDADVAGLVPAGVDLNTNAAVLMGNLVATLPFSGAAGAWCPYGTAGLGVAWADFEGRAMQPGGGSAFARRQANLAWGLGGGVMHAFTEHLGLRLDARYVHAVVRDDARAGGYYADYGFWRVTTGLTFGFPPGP